MTFEEFQKVDLRVAKVLSAKRIPESSKLISIVVAAGDQDGASARNREIVAGIGKAYKPENLVGEQVVIVANIEPRQFAGRASEGMLLAAHDADGRPVVLTVPEAATPGSRIS